MSAHAAEKIYEYKWSAVPARAEIPAEHADEDAVIIYDSTRFTIGRPYYVTQYRRIRIQSARGIEKYARIAIPNFSGSIMKTLDARTIKKNGQVVDLNNSDIKKLDIGLESLDNTVKVVLFSIPGVEIGDEIETISVIENAGLGYQHFLHDELPQLEVVYKIFVAQGIIMDLMLYNQMPQPTYKEEVDERIYTWHLKNLPGTGDQSACIMSLKLPFIIQAISGYQYSFWLRTKEKKWEDYVKFLIEEAKNDYNKSLKYSAAIEKLTKRVAGHLPQEDTIGRIYAVHRYIMDSVDVVLPNAENVVMPLGKTLEEKKILPHKLMFLYINLLELEEVPYYLGFARERYNGPIDPKIVSESQPDELFLAFQKNGKLYYIVPATVGEKYEINELPVSILSTYALVAKRDSNTAGQIFLTGKEEDNFRVHKVKANVDYQKNELRLDVQEILSGAFSTLFRHKYITAHEEKELKEYFKRVAKQRCPAAEVDTVYIAKGEGHPQTFRLNYTLVLKDKIAQLEDNLYSLSLEDLFWYNYEEIDAKKRTMDYYPLCTTSEDFKYYLMFNQKVELVNGESLKLEVAYPEIGDYKFSAKPVKDDIVLIESVCRKGGTKIPVEKIGQLAELNDAVKRADNEPLLFRIVN